MHYYFWIIFLGTQWDAVMPLRHTKQSVEIASRFKKNSIPDWLRCTYSDNTTWATHMYWLRRQCVFRLRTSTDGRRRASSSTSTPETKVVGKEGVIGDINYQQDNRYFCNPLWLDDILGVKLLSKSVSQIVLERMKDRVTYIEMLRNLKLQILSQFCNYC